MHRTIVALLLISYCAPTWSAEGNPDGVEAVKPDDSTERRSREEREAAQTDGLGYSRGNRSGKEEWFEPPRFNREPERSHGASPSRGGPNDPSTRLGRSNDNSSSPPQAGSTDDRPSDDRTSGNGSGQGRGIVNGLGSAVGSGVGQGIVNAAGGSSGGAYYGGNSAAASGTAANSAGAAGAVGAASATAAIPSVGAGVVTGGTAVISNTTNATRGVVNSAGGLVTGR